MVFDWEIIGKLVISGKHNIRHAVIEDGGRSDEGFDLILAKGKENLSIGEIGDIVKAGFIICRVQYDPVNGSTAITCIPKQARKDITEVIDAIDIRQMVADLFVMDITLESKETEFKKVVRTVLEMIAKKLQQMERI